MFPRLSISISNFFKLLNKLYNEFRGIKNIIWFIVKRKIIVCKVKVIESMLNDHWSVMKPAYFIIWFSFNNNFRFSIKWYSRAQQVKWHKYVKYTCSMETVHQNGRITLFSSKFLSIYSILYDPSIYPILFEKNAIPRFDIYGQEKVNLGPQRLTLI